ncbi:MAG: hypothetical protein HFI69_02940 [Lachnospiraceae bacterium]|nr:hypothetical protein [Lachnospiraceae bacterium]
MAKNDTKTAPAKETSTKPAAVKNETVAKPAEAKDEVAVKAAEEETTVEDATVKAAEPEKEVKAEEIKKEAAKKAPSKKVTKKPVAKKKETEKVEEIYVQYQALEITTRDIMEKAKQDYISEGHRESSIKSVRLYIKPEESMAYYVINDKFAGGVSL